MFWLKRHPVETEHPKKFWRIRKNFKYHQRLQDEYAGPVLIPDTESQDCSNITGGYCQAVEINVVT